MPRRLAAALVLLASATLPAVAPTPAHAAGTVTLIEYYGDSAHTQYLGYWRHNSCTGQTVTVGRKGPYPVKTTNPC